jgi:Flp pilus assembly pilin Flp
MKSFINKFVSDEKGLETVEYAVMTALVVAAMVTAITLLANAITNRFNQTATTINGIGGN